jgi:hypothetical protein
MSISWKAVEAALKEPIRPRGDFNWKFTRAMIYFWGQALVRSWNEFLEKTRLTDEEQSRIHQALFELNGRHRKAMGGDIGWHTAFVPKIRTEYGNFNISEERYNNIFALDLSRFEWESHELELMGLLGATKVGHLCQRRWEVELMPAAEHLAIGKDGLRAMELRFQGHVEHASKALLCFDMDLPGPFSQVYRRTPDAPWPWMDSEALRRFAMATVGRRRIVRP